MRESERCLTAGLACTVVLLTWYGLQQSESSGGSRKLGAPYHRSLMERGNVTTVYETMQQEDVTRSLSAELDRALPALVLAWVVGALANAAGVGGGMFYVPLFTSILNFSLKAAAGLSQAVIAGGSLASVAFYCARRHPTDPTRPFLDYNLALMLTPMLLFGVSIGVLLNVLFPEWILTILLVTLLSYLTVKTFRKSVDLHRRERKASAAAVASAVSAASVPGGVAAAGTAVMAAGGAAGSGETVREGEVTGAAEPSTGGATRRENVDGAGSKKRELRQLAQQLEMTRLESHCGPADAVVEIPPAGLEHQEAPAMAERPEGPEAEDGDPAPPPGALLPWREAGCLLGLWGGFLALQLIKSNYPRCSTPYYAIFAAQGAGSVAAAVIFTRRAHAAAAAEASRPLRAALLKPDIYGDGAARGSWSLGLLAWGCALMLAGGIIAGMLGIGGGVVIGPLLLDLRIHPLVAAATSSLMILFSSSAAALSLGFDGLLNRNFSLVFGLSCFASSIVGVTVVNRIVQRSGKASIVVMILAGILGVGCAMTGVVGGQRAVNSWRTKTDLGLGSFCS